MAIVRYTIHSPFHDEFARLSRRFERWGGIYWIFRFLGICLAWVAHAGQIFTCLFFVFPPFMLFRYWNLYPPNPVYWILASMVVVALAWGLFRVIRNLIRYLRQGIINLDLLALTLGLGFALFCALYMYPTGLPDFCSLDRSGS